MEQVNDMIHDKNKNACTYTYAFLYEGHFDFRFLILLV